ncbi:MAG: signal peptidase II [Candidatus Omnitrophica bacterium]|nr:signal peptidase II [Candidatus Omnitrophota bacterium]
MSIQGRKSQAVASALFILLILSIDQGLKYLVRQNLSVGESIPIISNALHITFVSNTGAAFGLFKNATHVFAVISIVAVVFIATLLIKTIQRAEFFRKPMLNFSLILILSGAIGNLLDRLLFSYVIDFIDVRVWPVFNVADSSITIGTVLLILSFIRQKPCQIDKIRNVWYN